MAREGLTSHVRLPASRPALDALLEHRVGPPAVADEVPDAALLRLVELLDPMPAWVVSRWWDVLACNEAYRDLTGDRQAGLGVRRNICRQSFTTLAMQSIYADWDLVAKSFVAGLRLALAQWPTDPAGAELVASLRAESSRFAQLWESPEHRPGQRIAFRVESADDGPLELDLVRLATSAGQRQYLVVLVPPDERAEQRLRALAGE